MSRSSDREEIFKILFQLIIKDSFASPDLISVAKENSRNSSQFVKGHVKNILDKKSNIDEVMGENLEDWDLDRIGTVERAILSIAIYEIMWCSEIDNKVSINEAIELAKKYGDEKAAPFVNGVLATIVN